MRQRVLQSLSLFILGVARSTQTGSVMRVQRRGKTFSIPSRKNPEWAATCARAAAEYAERTGHIPYDGPLEVAVTFYLPCACPKVHRRYPTTRPDSENLGKGLLDAWNHILWVDDSRIVTGPLYRKRYQCDEPQRRVGVLVTVTEIEPPLPPKRTRRYASAA